MYHKITTIIVSFFLSINLFSQINSDLYIQKTGFKEINLKVKNDTIKFIFSSTNKPKPTILFLQGSLPLPIVFYNEKSTNTLIPFNLKPYLEKFNFIIIARKGIPLVGSYEKDSKGYLDPKGKVPSIYLQNDNLKYRTFQANEVLNYVYKQNWVKRDSIFVIGHSEGYRVAAKLSENNKIISKLVCMSADPFNRTTEEIVKQRIKCLSNNQDSIFQSKINNFIDNYKSIGKNIEEYKDDYDLYNWASYNSELTFESLKKFKNPILVVYGTDDSTASNNDLLPFLIKNQDLTLKVYPDCDHNYFKKEFDKQGKKIEDSYHWDNVFKDISEWLLLKR